MFNGADDDSARSVSPTHSQVVRLGAATGKDHISTFETGGFSEDRSGFVECLTSTTAGSMRRSGVGVAFAKPREHRVERFGAQR